MVRGRQAYRRNGSNTVTARRMAHLAYDVEEERFDVVVEGLVVEKEFGQQAQIFGVDSLKG